MRLEAFINCPAKHIVAFLLSPFTVDSLGKSVFSTRDLLCLCHNLSWVRFRSKES